MCSLKNTYKHIPKSQTAHFSPVHACGVRPDGCARTCRTRFTNSFRGFRERSPRHTPCCCPAARKKEHCRMHAGAHARRDGATCSHPCTRAPRAQLCTRSSSNKHSFRCLEWCLLRQIPIESPKVLKSPKSPKIAERMVFIEAKPVS